MATSRVPTLLLVPILGVLACQPVVRADDAADRRAVRVEELRRDLRSDAPATVARSAFEAAGLYRSRSELVPDLLDALQRDTWAHAARSTRVIKHLLDALIQLDADVPMTEIERHEELIHTRTEAVILAARTGEAAHPLLRRVLRRTIDRGEIDVAGIAAGNLLAAAKDAHLAALLLPHLQPTVLVTVRDHDRMEGRGGSRVIVGVCTSCARCAIPEGFPTAVWYELSFRGRDWQPSLVAKGCVESVWHVRNVDEREQSFRCHSPRKRNATALGLGWAATLLGIPPGDLALEPRSHRSHRWRSPEVYATWVTGLRASIQRDAAALLDRLCEGGLLTREDRRRSAVEPLFQIEDEREDRTLPLPEVQGVRRR